VGACARAIPTMAKTIQGRVIRCSILSLNMPQIDGPAFIDIAKAPRYAAFQIRINSGRPRKALSDLPPHRQGGNVQVAVNSH
jgi:hypothetical protein